MGVSTQALRAEEVVANTSTQNMHGTIILTRNLAYPPMNSFVWRDKQNRSERYFSFIRQECPHPFSSCLLVPLDSYFPFIQVYSIHTAILFLIICHFNFHTFTNFRVQRYMSNFIKFWTFEVIAQIEVRIYQVLETLSLFVEFDTLVAHYL